jgi:hypothetical protein
VTILALSPSAILRAQDNCSDDAILSVKGSWKKRPDANMEYSKDPARVTRYIDSISRLFQATYPEPKGIEAGWYRSMGNPAFSGAPTSYTFNSLYFSWFCSKEMHKMALGDETGTWVWVFVNNLDAMIGRDGWSIAVNGFPIHTMPYKSGRWKGYDTYHPLGKSERGSCIFLFRPGQLPWRPISQLEYLTALKPFLEDLRKKSMGPSPEQQAADDQKEIERIQKNPDLKPELKQAMLNGIYDRQRQMRQYAANTKLPDAYDQKIRLIDNYIHSASPAQLQSPAVLQSNARDIFDGSFSSEEKGGSVLVIANPDYFNKQIPAYLPQCMVIYWTWDKGAASMDFKQKFEADFPVEKLQAMLEESGASHPSLTK